VVGVRLRDGAGDHVRHSLVDRPVDRDDFDRALVGRRQSSMRPAERTPASKHSGTIKRRAITRVTTGRRGAGYAEASSSATI